MTKQTPPEQSNEKDLVVADYNRIQRESNKKATTPLDVVKLALAGAIAGGGVWAFYYPLLGQPNYVRVAVLVAAAAIACLLVLFWCDFGRRLLQYFKDSVVEFRKVVWLPKNEAFSMTIRVVLFVLVLAVFIYGVDALISLIFNTMLVRG